MNLIIDKVFKRITELTFTLETFLRVTKRWRHWTYRDETGWAHSPAWHWIVCVLSDKCKDWLLIFRFYHQCVLKTQDLVEVIGEVVNINLDKFKVKIKLQVRLLWEGKFVEEKGQGTDSLISQRRSQEYCSKLMKR